MKFLLTLFLLLGVNIVYADKVVIAKCDMNAFLQAAVTYNYGPREFGHNKLISLGKDGCKPAKTFIDYLKTTTGEATPPEGGIELDEILSQRWKGMSSRPGPDMLYDTTVMLFMLFPDKDDKELAEWLTNHLFTLKRGQDIASFAQEKITKAIESDDFSKFSPIAAELLGGSPVLAHEASRRYANHALDKALYWNVIADARMKYLLESRGGYDGGGAEILTTWSDYSLRSLTEQIPDPYKFNVRRFGSIESLLKNWGKVVPDMTVKKTDDSNKKLKAALKSRFASELEVYTKKSELQKREDVAFFSIKMDALLKEMGSKEFKFDKKAKKINFDFISEKIESNSNQQVSPLMFSIAKQDKVLFNHLIKYGVNPNLTGEQGESPISMAVAMEDSYYLKTLLKHKGNPDSTGRMNMSSMTLSIAAKKWDNMKLLIQNGANVDFFGNSSQRGTPLIYLAKKGHFKQAMYLIKKGASYRKSTRSGLMVAHFVNEEKPTDSKYVKALRAFLIKEKIQLPLPKLPHGLRRQCKDESTAKECKKYVDEINEYNKVITKKFGPDGVISIESQLLKWAKGKPGKADVK